MKTINILTNEQKDSLEVAHFLVGKLEKEGFQIHDGFSEKGILNICIGGDGAFLKAAHESNFSDIPFVGINTGTLGFFQEIKNTEIREFIQNYKKGNYKVDELDTIMAKVYTEDGVDIRHSLNEFAVKNKSNTIIKIQVIIDGNELQNFAGDGLLVSSPSGSTAYNYGAGGAVLYQNLDGFQLTPMIPINSKAYRSLLNPLVLPSRSLLEFHVEGDESLGYELIVDGKTYSYENGIIQFQVSNKKIYKLVFDENWYWENLKDKFL